MIFSNHNLKKTLILLIVTVLVFSSHINLIGKGTGKLNFTGKVVLSIPFGRGDGKIGYLNGPEHTPYPEAAQAFRLLKKRILVVDTINQRLIMFDSKTGKRLSTMWPNTETKNSYYSAVIEVNNDLFLAPELVHRALHLFNIAGKVKYIGDKTCPVDDITSIFMGKNDLIYLADKGLTEKKVKVLNREMEFLGSLSLPDMSAQSVALDADDNICSIITRLDKEDPSINIYSSKKIENKFKFKKNSTLKLKGNTFPPGRCGLSGIDSAGNYYVFWSALKSYFDKKNQAKFPDYVKKTSELQPVALFNVFDKKGIFIGEFFAPVSTSPASTVVTPDGEVYVMDYDAAGAPKGNFKIKKYFRK
ncbi:hypothetical protein KAJ27_09725 [bacterium]|nr:hypothetical protein [bacterium]